MIEHTKKGVKASERDLFAMLRLCTTVAAPRSRRIASLLARDSEMLRRTHEIQRPMSLRTANECERTLDHDCRPRPMLSGKPKPGS